MSETVKPCVKCGGTDRYADGRCKACSRKQNRKYSKSNREKLADYGRKWREANHEMVVGYQREYYEANKQKLTEHNRKWREDNREKFKQCQRNWHEANRDRVAGLMRNWQKDNPEKVREIYHNRRARIKGNGGKLSHDIIKTLLVRQNSKCACCNKSLKDGYHLDHIMPIALGGKNTDENVQLLTPKCNLSKGAKHPIDYMRAKGRLI